MFTWAALAAPFVRKRFQQRTIIIIYFLPRLRMLSRWKLASSDYAIVQSLPCIQTAEDVFCTFCSAGLSFALCSFGCSLFCVHSGRFPTTLEEFENRGLTLKSHEMFFFVHTISEKFENAAISSHFGFVFEKNSLREITRLVQPHLVEKFLFENVFTLKCKAGFVKFFPSEKRFRKVPFS